MKRIVNLLFLFFPMYTFCQNTTLKGILKDSVSQELLVGVGVSSNTKSFSRSNLNGEYFLKLKKILCWMKHQHPPII
ncbi:MAG TPA: hypothetical protein PLU17_10385, partial [Chitinophagaceae bacterium]|nr:hypothetical protein [Chitinophagaceae bacterium]